MELLISTLTPEQQVENGIRVLDRKWPGWEKDVDLARLYQADGSLCILGQVTRARVGVDPGCAAYSLGMVALGLWSNEQFHRTREYRFGTLQEEWERSMLVVNHGFGASNAVQEIWKERIRARRALQQAAAVLQKRELLHVVGAIVVFVCLAMLGWVGEAGAQVMQSPRAVQFDCPITTFTDLLHGGVPTGIYVDFYACDSQGGNCAASPQFTSPSPTSPLHVTDSRLAHLPDGVTCEITFANMPYPLGQVFITKGRWTNAAGDSQFPSDASLPFTTPQPRPNPIANWRTVP